MPGAVVGAVASGLAGGLVNNVFGGGDAPSPQAAMPQPSVLRLRTPGFQYERSGSGPMKPKVEVRRAEEMNRLMGRLDALGNKASNRFGDLLSRVRPGFSDMRKARVNSIRDTFARERAGTIGNLRENLARRSVLGSSFADASISQAESAFADAEARAIGEALAQSFLEEIDMTQQLATQDFNVTSAVIQAMIDQGNFETTAAINLANGTQQSMAEAARLQQELAIANASGAGAFFQPAIDAIGSGVGDFVSGLFG